MDAIEPQLSKAEYREQTNPRINGVFDYGIAFEYQ